MASSHVAVELALGAALLAEAVAIAYLVRGLRRVAVARKHLSELVAEAADKHGQVDEVWHWWPEDGEERHR
jgi:hypothetical protein